MDKDQSPSWNSYGDDEPEEKPRNSMFDTRADFFKSFIAERTAQSAAEIENDEEWDEDSQSNKKKKRFTSLLKTVFPSIVSADRQQRPVGASESQLSSPIKESEEAKIVPSEDISKGAAEQPFDLEEPNAEPTEVIIEHKNEIVEIDKKNTPLSIEAIEKDDKTEAVHKPQAKTSEKAVLEQADSSPEPDHDPTFAARPIVPNTPPPIAINPANIQTHPGYNPNVPPVSPNVQSAKERVVIERQRATGAILAFLGAEFLSRRRDRKLEKKIKQEAKTRQQSLHELRKHQAAQAETVQATASTQNQRIRNINRLQEQSITYTSSRENIPSSFSEIPPPPLYYSAQEKKQNNESSLTARRNQEDKIQRPSYEGSRPSAQQIEAYKRFDRPAKQEQVQSVAEVLAAKTAEKEATRTASQHETLYKKAAQVIGTSHPVPKDSSSGNSFSPPTPIPQPFLVNSSYTDSSRGAPNQPRSTASSYKKPITYGVAGAFAILLLALITYALR